MLWVPHYVVKLVGARRWQAQLAAFFRGLMYLGLVGVLLLGVPKKLGTLGASQMLKQSAKEQNQYVYIVQIAEKINQQRKMYGLPPLKLDDALISSAYTKAIILTGLGQYGHDVQMQDFVLTWHQGIFDVLSKSNEPAMNTVGEGADGKTLQNKVEQSAAPQTLPNRVGESANLQALPSRVGENVAPRMLPSRVGETLAYVAYQGQGRLGHSSDQSSTVQNKAGQSGVVQSREVQDKGAWTGVVQNKEVTSPEFPGVPPEAVVANWLKSLTHRQVVLSPEFTHIGVGAAYNTGTKAMVVVAHFAKYDRVVQNTAKTHTSTATGLKSRTAHDVTNSQMLIEETYGTTAPAQESRVVGNKTQPHARQTMQDSQQNQIFLFKNAKLVKNAKPEPSQSGKNGENIIPSWRTREDNGGPPHIIPSVRNPQPNSATNQPGHNAYTRVYTLDINYYTKDKRLVITLKNAQDLENAHNLKTTQSLKSALGLRAESSNNPGATPNAPEAQLHSEHNTQKSLQPIIGAVTPEGVFVYPIGSISLQQTANIHKSNEPHTGTRIEQGRGADKIYSNDYEPVQKSASNSMPIQQTIVTYGDGKILAYPVGEYSSKAHGTASTPAQNVYTSAHSEFMPTKTAQTFQAPIFKVEYKLKQNKLPEIMSWGGLIIGFVGYIAAAPHAAKQKAVSEGILAMLSALVLEYV